MKRRDFIALAGAAAVFPPAAFSQQASALPLVALFRTGLLSEDRVAQEADGLRETGFVVGKSVTLEQFSADGSPERLPEVAAAMLLRRPAVIVAGGGDEPVQAAKAATSTVPIVFESGVDPVASGVVRSFNQPGGNITGVYILGRELDAKRLDVLHDLVPGARVVGVLTNPEAKPPIDLTAVSAAAAKLGIELAVAGAARDSELDAAFALFRQKGAQAVLMVSDPTIGSTQMRAREVALALSLGLPTISPNSLFADVGGLASYSPNQGSVHRQLGILAGRILKGEKPGDIPVEQPTAIEFVVNLKTARALGITIPPTVMFRVDRVIEV